MKSVRKKKVSIPDDISAVLEEALKADSRFITITYKDPQTKKLQHWWGQNKFMKEDVAITFQKLKEDFNANQVI